jgi:osmotically-inducible protein OsmY
MKSDVELKQHVEDELRFEPRLHAAAIGVAIEDGVVTLSGSVDSWAEKWAAEQAVKRVAGVAAVAEEIDVRIPVLNRRSDADVARAAANALAWNTFVPAGSVKVTVEDGWVTLEGVVASAHEKSAAADAVRRLTGVRGVTNLVALKRGVTAATVNEDIRRAFERIASLDARGVTVDVDDGRATLRGTVRSWAEREAAEGTAWSAPGITDVDNRLVVSR